MVFCTDCGTNGALSIFINGQWRSLSFCDIVAPTSGTHTAYQQQIIWNWNTVSGATGYKWNTANNYSTAMNMGSALTKTESGLTCNTQYIRYIWAYSSCGVSSATILTQSTTSCSFQCGQIYTDSRDGQSYQTIQIGTQCWMSQNINYQTGTSWCYDNSPTNCTIYGRLYDWYTASSVCPPGWHLPSNIEWCTLTTYIDATVDCNFVGWTGTDVGYKMKSTSGWNSAGNGSNASGFNGLPGGHCCFSTLGDLGYFWSSWQESSADAWIYALKFDYNTVNKSSYSKGSGFSVRCLKD